MPKFSARLVAVGVFAVCVIGIAILFVLALTSTSTPQLTRFGGQKINAKLPPGWTMQDGSFVSPDGSLEVTARSGGCGLNSGEPTLPPSGLTVQGQVDSGGGSCHGYVLGDITIGPGPSAPQSSSPTYYGAQGDPDFVSRVEAYRGDLQAILDSLSPGAGT
jgi:hypothetical protein